MSTRPLVTPISVLAAVLVALFLLALTACSREKSDWRSAQAADSPESYQQFIDEHPESSHVATARERLQQLAEEKDWRAAAGADTQQAYQQFLKSSGMTEEDILSLGQVGEGSATAHRQFQREPGGFGGRGARHRDVARCRIDARGVCAKQPWRWIRCAAGRFLIRGTCQ